MRSRCLVVAMVCVVGGLLSCSAGPDVTTPHDNEPVLNLSGRWVGTITQPGGPAGDIFEYRLDLVHSQSNVTGTASIRWLTQPRHFADFVVSGSVDTGGRLQVQEIEITAETNAPNVYWCRKQATLSYSPVGGGRLSGSWLAPGCIPGIVRLQREAPNLVVWPTAPTHLGSGFAAPCGDQLRGCFWLTAGGWRDAQPFRQEFNDTFNGFHLGADWNRGSGSADANEPVYAIAGGTVSSVKADVTGWGNVVFVLHVLPIGTVTSMYAHVNWNVSGSPVKGDTVGKGLQIARIGDGNNRYPYHLHFEIRAGDNTSIERGYMTTQTGRTPQGQIDPNIFLGIFR